MAFDDELLALIPLAVVWATEESERILSEGVALAPDEVELARKVGVTEPEKVRLHFVDRIPSPEHPALAAACEQLGFLGDGTAGLTLGHGIYIQSSEEGDRRLLAHELRHVVQYEQHDGIPGFLAVYIRQILEHGYYNAPYEVDARRAEALA